MNLRELVQAALLLAVGYILHLIVPGFALGMKPDLLLGMLFIVIMLSRSFSSVIVAGLAAGLITALTTTFPGGQLPNIVDKFFTSLIVFGLVALLRHRVNDKVVAGIVGALGTVVSGSIFLGSAAVIAGLPGSFAALFVGAVLPATVVNTIAVVILYPIVLLSRSVVDKGRGVPAQRAQTRTQTR